MRSLASGLGALSRKGIERLTTSDGGDVDVVFQHGLVSRGNGERDLCQCRIKRINRDDRGPLVVQAQSVQENLDVGSGVDGPDADVVAVLVCQAGAGNV